MGPLAPVQCLIPFPVETLMVLCLGVPGNGAIQECVPSLAEHPTFRKSGNLRPGILRSPNQLCYHHYLTLPHGMRGVFQAHF